MLAYPEREMASSYVCMYVLEQLHEPSQTKRNCGSKCLCVHYYENNVNQV
jgi:hypothetical protein